MTQRVRSGYRNHRRRTWALGLVLVAAIAAIMIPIALAASSASKYYTLTFAPATVCSSATDGAASTVMTLKNTAGSQTLGSAEIYFPAGTVYSVSAPATVSTGSDVTSNGTKDIVSLQNLNLAKNGLVAVTVSFVANAAISTQIQAVVKQSNNFNDTQGGANLFTLDPSQAGFPMLQVVPCVTVSGRVYQDRNLDNTYTTDTGGAFLNSDVPKAWNVNLYAKTVGAPASSYALVRTTISSSSDGSYSFTQVPTVSDYKICVTARSPDTGSKWALQSPTGNTDCAPISTGGPTTAANRLPNLSADAPGQDFQVVPVVGPFGGDTNPSTVGGYTVDASSNSTKADTYYVQDTWTDSNGNTNFRFSPINACTPPNCPSGKIYLLETLIADVNLSDLGGQQVSIQYDDMPPFLDGDLKPMPYCNFDPRNNDGTLATSGVLPGTDTSCIVEGSQNVVAGGKVHAEYKVYTSYDGGRQIGVG